MSRKNSSIVSYPDSDDDNDPLHYIKRSRAKQENVHYTSVYKQRGGRNTGGARDPRLEARSRDPRLQPREKEYPRAQPRNHDPRDPRGQTRPGEHLDERHGKGMETNVHYEPVYQRKVREYEKEREHANSYESAGARWKQYKTEKAAEISKPDKYKSAESGWKKLKSENKWDTSNWNYGSESSDEDDGDNYNRKTPKSKIDLFSNPPVEEDNVREETSNEKDFWWKYKDDDPIPVNTVSENASKSEEKNDDLFDEILSGNLADNDKDVEKTDDITDDFLYEDVLQQSRKILEEGKAFLGEPVTESHDRNEFNVQEFGSFQSTRGAGLSSQNMSNNDLHTHYHNENSSFNRIQRAADENDKDRGLYRTEQDELEEEDVTWARSVTVEKKDESNWSDESLSPIRRDEPSPDEDVQVNLVSRRSPARPRERSPSYSPTEGEKRRKNSSSEPRSPPPPPPQKPQVTMPAQPVVTNPYDNPKLNVDNIDRYYDDLMEWNYSHRCLICDKTFENLTKWTEHILDTKHGREFHLDPYRCPPCHEMFRTKHEWKMHMAYAPSHGFMGSINVPKPRTILPPSPAFPVQHGWRCKGCYIISQTDEDALRHIKYVHLIHTAQYPCPLCGEPFWHQRDLDRHADDVHAPPKYQCDICHRAFESGEKLQTHRLIKHSKKITCYKCDKQIDELIFKEHCEMHKLEMLKCDYCGDMFKDSYHLEKHLKYDHKKYRHHRRSSSRSPDRRSSRRRSRRSSSRSRRSSSRSRRSSTRDDQRRREEKPPRGDSPPKEQPRNSGADIGERRRSQDDSSIPSSNCATPTRDEEEDIFPPGDESYRKVSPKLNENTMEAAPVTDEQSRPDGEFMLSSSPRGIRESQDTRHSRSRQRSRERSRDKQRSRSKSYDSRYHRSSYRDDSRSRDRYSSRRHESSRRSRSQSRERKYDRRRSRSRSRSRERKYERKRSRSRSPSRDKEYRRKKSSSVEDTAYYEQRGEVAESSNHNDASPSREDRNEDDDDDDETEWERRISTKMIVKDEIWEKEDEDKPNGVSPRGPSKDLPIFDIPKEEEEDDNLTSRAEGKEANATWVVETPMEEKDSKPGEEGENDEDKKQFVCKECGKSLGSLMQLRDHFTVKHKKGYNLRGKRPSTDVKKSQPIVEKEPKLTDEQKEIAKLIEGFE